MEENIKVELGSVQKTLLLPLWGRAIESKKENPLIVDRCAVEIVKQLDYDFSEIQKNYDETNHLSWIVRCINIDRTIKKFLKEYPNGTIVNIGCGLDTTFERVDNNKLTWYDLDFPDTITLREKLISGNNRRKNIRSSVLEYNWFEQVQQRSKVLFIGCGVFYYFEENELKCLFKKIADCFPGSQMIFDKASLSGIKLLNKNVIKGSGMDEKALMRWGEDNIKDIEAWDERIIILAEYPYYSNIPKDAKLSMKTKFKIWASNRLNYFSMVHLQFR